MAQNRDLAIYLGWIIILRSRRHNVIINYRTVRLTKKGHKLCHLWEFARLKPAHTKQVREKFQLTVNAISITLVHIAAAYLYYAMVVGLSLRN